MNIHLLGEDCGEVEEGYFGNGNGYSDGGIHVLKPAILVKETLVESKKGYALMGGDGH